MSNLSPSGVFFHALNTSKLVFGRTPLGERRKLPGTLRWLWRGLPSQSHTLSPWRLRCIDRSRRRLRRLACQTPTQIPGYVYGSSSLHVLDYIWTHSL